MGEESKGLLHTSQWRFQVLLSRVVGSFFCLRSSDWFLYISVYSAHRFVLFILVWNMTGMKMRKNIITLQNREYGLYHEREEREGGCCTFVYCCFMYSTEHGHTLVYS